MKYDISASAKLPTRFGDFLTISVREYVPDSSSNAESSGTNSTQPILANIKEHLIVYTPNLVKAPSTPPLVRIHSECLTGDVFGSKKCDCGNELALAMEKIAQSSEGGMLIYLRQEGRGIGLFNKIEAYALQDSGLDTVEANLKLGFKEDMRSYEIVGEIFKHFGITEINLLTNNPRKIDALAPYAKVVRQSIITPCNPHNEGYLQVKKQKLGHLL